MAVLPLLLAAVACQADGPAQTAPDHAVYGQPLSGHIRAAQEVTAESGSARFTYTLTYETTKGPGKEVVTGAQDYAERTADATRTLTLPRGLSEETERTLGSWPGGEPQMFEVTGSDVAYRMRSGDWLRYSASGSQEFAQHASAVLYRAGDNVPFGGTPEDVLTVVARPAKGPAVDEDGRRTYSVMAKGLLMQPTLPGSMDMLLTAGVPDLPMTVTLDADGLLTEATADYAPLLADLHRKGHLKEVTAMKGVHRLTEHGRAEPRRSSKGAVDAEKALTDLHRVRPGACASDDTGLGHVRLVRVVACSARHDLQVYAHVNVALASSSKAPTEEDAYRDADRQCRREFDSAPSAWVARARPAGTFLIAGDTAVSSTIGGDDHATGAFVCYVTTS
ncbi:hypothetical protein ABZO31_23475 [Streptomyces sp. HUAS MG47]|uniref:hypothetical protein n=1 Tax=Streptomyces solicamelliae TaxID=3231716 RepID=UPI003877BC6F